MTAFITSVGSIVTILIMMALGFGLRGLGWFDDKFSGSISKLIMNVALPASIFMSVMKNLTLPKLVSLSSGLIYSFGGVIIGYIIAWIAVKALKIRPGRRGLFMNTVVNANTIFIGLPLNLALFGTKSLPYFLVYYVTNTVSTWAFGVFLIQNDDPTKEKGAKSAQAFNWKKLLPPPLLGFLVSLVWLLLRLPVPDWAGNTLTYIGGLVTPLSLIYIGIVLYDAGLKSIKFDRDTILALLGRFVLAPVVITLLILFGAHIGHALPSMEMQTLIVQASAPGLAVMPILANEAHGDVEYATNLVTTSTILFIIVVPIVMTLIQFI
ncbi:AEC family transporter [Pediococcus claussenii]|uniref:Malate permease n=1 Tax=Pediococcus claussenii (strain ATCC BAA-344 / DSM 14800 / JCM 18046 / KCTC 3811 / LMG 21948 / P06) TaxID=701521 RepID=G8PAD7_PEDCP|nr:AEC family transporter [Pediococcus claussenii]AEV95726.1 Malate permease [Pediococcus claussenii ATCC BAA-344]ANZ69236.1 malate permease [Pediococcus claussenii]ANZ71055.1 malate permease [Pediococcus claussenii]KRN20039.1 mleP protein [Pediococcus claussenii]